MARHQGRCRRRVGGSDAYAIELDSDGAVQWSMRFGGTGDDRCTAATIGSDGNFYLGGEFTGTIRFPDDDTADSRGGDDLFVLALSPGGDQLWATSFGADQTDNLEAIESVRGEVVVGGRVLGDSTNLPCGEGNCGVLGDGKGFVTWIDPTDGRLDRTVLFGGGHPSDEVTDIAQLSDGTVYVAGVIGSMWTLDDCSVSVAVGGVTHGFVAKLAPDQTCTWVEDLAASGGHVQARSVAASEAESGDVAVVVGGTAAANIDSFAAGPSNPHGGSTDAFVARLTDEGGLVTEIWVRYHGSINEDSARHVAIDPATLDVLATGIYRGTFGLDDDTSLELAHTGNMDVYAVRVGARGSELLWYAGFGSTGNEEVHGIHLFRDRVFLHGSFSETTDLGFESRASAGASDAFAMAFSPDGPPDPAAD